MLFLDTVRLSVALAFSAVHTMDRQFREGTSRSSAFKHFQSPFDLR
jgi:hypothetical protein